MALLPRAMRPSVIIRRRALYRGVLGPSLMWKGVAVLVYGRSTLKKVFGKQPEPLGTEVLEVGQFVSVESLGPPLTRKQRKQARRAS